MTDTLIHAEHVSKRFCTSLRKSLWYGVQDVCHSLNPWSKSDWQGDQGRNIAQTALRRDEFWALQDVNFQVKRGECLGLIGHNGAGKSTLLKILNGLIRPDHGRITMRGRVGAMIELGAGFNPILTGRENIYNQAALLGFSRNEVKSRFDEIVEFSEISHALDMPLQNYSSGMRIRLGFSVFAHLEPDVLLIDEVLAVGDVGFRMKSLNKMSELLNHCAVIFVTHTMPQVFRVCSQLMLLKRGCVQYSGRDIAEGVSQYFAAFDTGEQAITGSGDVQVLSLAGATPRGTYQLNECAEIRFGERLTISAKLKLSGGYQGGKVQLLFWNSELLPVMDVMTDDLTGFHFSVDGQGLAEVSVTIAKVILNAGKYNVSVIVLSEDLKVLCRHDSALIVNVTAACASGASVIVPAEWGCSTQA